MTRCEHCDTDSNLYDFRCRGCELRHCRMQYTVFIRDKERFYDALIALKQRGEQLTAMTKTGESP